MTLPAALLSCTALGFQHGIDWDHVAAISDVTSTQYSAKDATRCGALYAAGHAATVGLLGFVAILLGRSLPSGVAGWMQKIVGLSLILMAGYVWIALFSRRGPVSRGEALVALLGRKSATGTVHQHAGKSSLSLGVLHGIGAETPTQLSMLVIATDLGGVQNGILSLSVFALGMFASNMVLTTAATRVFRISKVRPTVFRWVGGATAAYSLWIGLGLMR